MMAYPDSEESVRSRAPIQQIKPLRHYQKLNTEHMSSTSQHMTV
jgi:hypothetical protein